MTGRGWIMAIILGAAITGSAVELVREVAASEIEHLAAKPANMRTLDEVMRWEQACAPACPSRALRMGAVARMKMAAGLPQSTERARLLGVAHHQLFQAASMEPLNGDAWVELSYLDTLGGQSPKRLVSDLGRSYDIAPFEREAGSWRVGAAAKYWDALPDPLRLRVLEEAEWLWSIDPHARPGVEGAFTDSQARLAFASRLAEDTVVN